MNHRYSFLHITLRVLLTVKLYKKKNPKSQVDFSTICLIYPQDNRKLIQLSDFQTYTDLRLNEYFVDKQTIF